MKKITVGIPKALFYYYYKDLWNIFFDNLNIKIVLSDKTNKEILKNGENISQDEACLSLKNYLGHIINLKDKCDYILVPRLYCVKKNEGVCTNFNALYDLVNNLFNIKIINYNVDLENKKNLKKGLISMGLKLGFSYIESYKAYINAVEGSIALRNKRELLQQDILYKSKNKKILLAGHPYNLYDPNWKGNGAIPHGVVINKGKIISEYKDAGVGGGFIGFNKDNKLILGKMSLEKAQTMNYRDAIEFGPFLVINGKKTKIKGNGGWGVAPRTAIGQRKDGTVIFLVVDGRISSSIGVTMDEVADIMLKYKAINAANLDGGSSSELLIDSKIINNPTGGGVDNLRKMPLYWVLK